MAKQKKQETIKTNSDVDNSEQANSKSATVKTMRPVRDANDMVIGFEEVELPADLLADDDYPNAGLAKRSFFTKDHIV